ncbi:ead/Ea22-like family protein [Klebsiella pneumoniae]|uniref:ead/Ea22-like family protein n=1 Tax=Klebsiella pneumoniae TaxID=573 RepID=UPI000672093E|nr:ead/Ea22-like family protein [Klebsiella pneumoniae]MDW1448064.1 ead/Ea22-like family protein [Klebsiella pneumoniae]SWF03304.1 Ead domain protein [Klebsiella pneumoniae]VFZ27629.1 Ead domain protein [Klebsiella pneumoniae]
MTDITELAQSLKAAADREMICRDVAETSEIWERTVTPENILVLVEALASEKRICATWRKTAESTGEKLEKAQAINAAAEKLVRCKGRYHSEQNYRALAALFGVKTPDLPPLEHENVHYADAAEMEIAALRQRIAELESRTVTIEPFRSFVTDADLAALHRFAECCDDPESGGHDLEKEQVRRLEEIGALRRSGHVHWITGFGDVMISITAGIKVEAE